MSGRPPSVRRRGVAELACALLAEEGSSADPGGSSCMYTARRSSEPRLAPEATRIERCRPSATRHGSASATLVAQRLEAGAHLFREELRLLPGGKVATFGKLVVVDQVGICLLRPTPRRLGEFIREGAHGHRKLHALRAKEAQLVAEVVLPVETGRGNPGVRQPEQRDVVEDVVAREAFGDSIEGA